MALLACFDNCEVSNERVEEITLKSAKRQVRGDIRLLKSGLKVGEDREHNGDNRECWLVSRIPIVCRNYRISKNNKYGINYVQ